MKTLTISENNAPQPLISVHALIQEMGTSADDYVAAATTEYKVLYDLGINVILNLYCQRPHEFAAGNFFESMEKCGLDFLTAVRVHGILDNWRKVYDV